MADNKKFPKSELPIRKTKDLLPKVFQTPANDKFLSGVLDPLVQPGVVDKISGYIGKRYGKTFKGNDVYQINIFLYDEQSRIVSQAIISKKYTIEKIPQKTTIKGTKVQGGTIAPTKTEITKPPLLIRKKPEITAHELEQAVVILLTKIKQ